MLTVNLFDSEFPGQPCSVNGRTPRQVEYVRDRMEWDGISVFTDRMIYDPVVAEVRSRVKVAWLLEGRCLRSHYYERIGEVAGQFDAILTTDPELLSRGGKYRQVIRGGAWTPVEKWGLYPKTRGVSLLLSEKRETRGHQLRHAIAEKYGDRIEVYHNTPKVEALRDYRYTVVVEACLDENWFSEHLLDAIAYGTVPLYCGCPNIEDWLDTGGILEFVDLDTLGLWLKDARWLTDFFDITEGARAGNLERARQYAITDDWVAENVYLPMLAVQP